MAQKGKRGTDAVFRYPRRIERLAKDAAAQAIEAAKNHGVSVTYVRNGILVREWPDGRIEKIGTRRFPRRKLAAVGTTIRAGG